MLTVLLLDRSYAQPEPHTTIHQFQHFVGSKLFQNPSPSSLPTYHLHRSTRIRIFRNDSRIPQHSNKEFRKVGETLNRWLRSRRLKRLELRLEKYCHPSTKDRVGYMIDSSQLAHARQHGKLKNTTLSNCRSGMYFRPWYQNLSKERSLSV